VSIFYSDILSADHAYIWMKFKKSDA